MALVINTNIGSIQAERALAGTRETMETSMQRLATGRRINSASDDAAGIAVASRMTDQMRALNMAIRNASDGLSLAQTAEGAIEEMQNILQRMRELGVQAANGTYTDTDRSYLDLEYQALMSEMYRISKSTAWDKDLKVLDDDVKAVDIQVGADSGESLNVPLGPLTPRALGLTRESGRTDFKSTAAAPPAEQGPGFGGISGKDAAGAEITDTTVSNTHTSADLVNRFKEAGSKGDGNFALGTDVIISVAITGGRSLTVSAEDIGSPLDLVTKLNADIDSIAEGITFSLVNGTGTAITLNGAVSTAAELPKNATNGHKYFVAADGKEYSFNSTTSVWTPSASALKIHLKMAIANNDAGQPVTAKARLVFSEDTSGIDSMENASKALAKIDTAQDIVNAQRSKLGAAMNRVQYTISNLMNVVENTSEAKSRIYDTDYAAESAALARTQVLAQAGTAMLAQANQSTQYVLNLLRQG